MRYRDFMTVHAQQHRQRLRRVAIIVGYQHSPAGDCGRRGGGGTRRARAGTDPNRQAHRELAAVSQAGAGGLDRAAVQLDQAFRQGQANSQSALRAVHRRVHLREHAEDLGQVLGADTEAGIRDADYQMAALATRAKSFKRSSAARCSGWKAASALTPGAKAGPAIR